MVARMAEIEHQRRLRVGVHRGPDLGRAARHRITAVGRDGEPRFDPGAVGEYSGDGVFADFPRRDRTAPPVDRWLFGDRHIELFGQYRVRDVETEGFLTDLAGAES